MSVLLGCGYGGNGYSVVAREYIGSVIGLLARKLIMMS